MTISRDAGSDLTMIFAVYTDELRRYPVDAVRTVLREWPGKYWPAIAELKPSLDRLVVPRRALLIALERGYRQPEKSPDWIPPTADEKAAVDAFLAAHGFSGEWRGRERPLEDDPAATREQRRLALDELRHFRLPDVTDPRVQARLREMGAE